MTANHRARILSFVSVMACAAVSVRMAAGQGYVVTDMGTLPSNQTSKAYAISNSGQVAGTSLSPGSPTVRAFAQRNFTMIDLGSLGGANSLGYGINDSGFVVGKSRTAGGLDHAFMHNGTSMSDLGTLGGSQSYAHGINNAGSIVGQAQIANGEWRAFLYEASVMNDLGTLGGSGSAAYKINDAGQATGYALTGGNAAAHAFVWSSGAGMTDLGTLGGTNSYGQDINGAGAVVGYSQVAGDAAMHAFLWTEGGGMIDLGALGGSAAYAYGVNDAGQAVGAARTAGGQLHAFVYDGGPLIDLNDAVPAQLNWTLERASDITGAGVIAGFGTRNGQVHAFMLEPCSGGGDCNGNGLPDACDIANRISADCNQNGVPDDCDVSSGTSQDCNGNGIPDDCDSGQTFTLDFEGFAEYAPINTQFSDLGVTFSIAGNPGASPIIAISGTPASGYGSPSGDDAPTVSGIGTLTDPIVGVDPFSGQDIVATFSIPVSTVRLFVIDIDGSESATVRAFDGAVQVASQTFSVSDNEAGDGRATAFTVSAARITSVVIDVPASIGFGIDDFTFTQVDRDCNDNSVLDSCDLTAGTSMDCDANGVPDECDPDCNANGIPDACDIASATSMDCNGNGVPDECDLSGTVIVGDRDDFDNADGDGVADVVSNDSIDFPGLGFGQTSGNGENFTDVSFATTSGSFNYVFTLPRGLYASAILRIFTFDVDTTTGWNVAPVNFDGVDSGLRLTMVPATPSLTPGFVYLDEFILDSTQRLALTDGQLTLTLVGAGLPSDTIVIDFMEIEYVLDDCNNNGILDSCEIDAGTLTDCNDNGIPDSCELTGGLNFDCNTNGILDDCDLAGGGDDCNTNAIPDECDLAAGTSMDCDSDGFLDECDLILDAATCRFPTMLTENTTGFSNAFFVGPPDDVYVGLGGQLVTYLIDCAFVYDAPGLDFTVYEVDSGTAEFGLMNVLISDDGLSFVSVKSSESAAVRIPGDQAHGNSSFARSYDLSVSGLTTVKYIRIDGNGTGPSGVSTDFDLDAIGIINAIADCNLNGVPDNCDVDSGASGDCNGNGVPDECEFPDCNTNGVGDPCDIAAGTSEDCNNNGIPDECEVAGIVGPVDTNLLVNPGAETGDITGWTGNPSFDVRTASPAPFAGSFYFFPGSTALHTLTQTVDLAAQGFLPANLDNNLMTAHVGGYQISFDQSPVDSGQITVDFLDENLIVIGSFAGPVKTNTAAWELTEGFVPLPAGTRFVRYTFTATRAAGTNNDGYLDEAFVILTATNDPDCNNNGIPDECDIASGTSMDANTNGIPDECEGAPIVQDPRTAVPPNVSAPTSSGPGERTPRQRR